MLHDIGVNHGTDKADAAHSFRGESYLDVYEQYLAPMRESEITLLELGVKSGASLRMWREYFPLADIHGVDLNPWCLQQESERISIHWMSQDDEEQLDAVADRVGGFDLVLDDCSHINSLTAASYSILWRHVRPGGFYVIEDLGMSWHDYSLRDDTATFMDGELAMNIERGVDPRQSRSQLSDRFESILFEMDMLRGDVRYLHFWPNLAIAQKCRD